MMSVLQKSILGNQEAQDTLEYVAMALVAIVLAYAVWQAFQSMVDTQATRVNEQFNAIGN